ncbi:MULTISPECIES: peroxiredoxin-like family protein [unclassified Oceanobacter]|uniref:peroxiredoxin-like family protein n=1 Tax=unclassified Oceanobacter TaxID=2620260 RepID=UPI002735A552|nr:MULTISPECIES: peroxiredoxin-like family protein [unclassified Oceanobacter]MDP2608873.1 peroxiredoxin-like family protein [Oceanobacter sp. 1_MG-2023]MDP2611885.1 peroxiredoxin-like family protein [Oceanobacter sp. 2_MG-2023]
MTSLRQQTDAQIEKTRQANPVFMQAIEDVLESARRFEAGCEAIAVGQTAPDFSLPNASGEPVSLAAMLANGPVVIAFYRGSWCPYCNLELRALQARLADIHGLGAELIAISPQMPDESLTQPERGALAFPVLSDQDALVAAQFGVAWQVPDIILEHMRVDRKLDLADLNKGNGSILPIPATFVLDRHGVVAWQFVDVDYRKRAEPEDVVAVLQQLAGE